MNYRVIIRLSGLLLLVESAFMLLTVGVALLAGSGDAGAIAISALICFVPGIAAFLLTREIPKKITRKEGFLVVTLVWLIFSLFGALPYVISGTIPSYTDAFFESMSGFSTTGASIIDNVDVFPKGIVFWRSLTHWLGGMGIIALVVSFLPLLGIGGGQLFDAEAPGPTVDKITPRIHHTARYLWGLYVIFTVIETVLLMFGGMDLFDSVCHSFATMATGGFSTKQASIAHWNSPFIEYVISLFMIIAGTNFVLMLTTLKGKPGKIFHDEEFRNYIRIIGFFTLVIAAGLYFTAGTGLEKSIRTSLFTVTAIITTTGFVVADYLQWSPILIMLVIALFFLGGSTGSTGGGIKIMRIVIVMKNGYYELKRMIHPNAVIPVRYNHHTIDAGMVSNILAFFVLYMVAFFLGSMIMLTMVPEMDTAFGAVASCLGNIGPGLGSVGPVYTYSHMPDAAKWLLSFMMMLGRLELFTVLVIFTPSFWKG